GSPDAGQGQSAHWHPGDPAPATDDPRPRLGWGTSRGNIEDSPQRLHHRDERRLNFPKLSGRGVPELKTDPLAFPADPAFCTRVSGPAGFLVASPRLLGSCGQRCGGEGRRLVLEQSPAPGQAEPAGSGRHLTCPLLPHHAGPPQALAEPRRDTPLSLELRAQPRTPAPPPPFPTVAGKGPPDGDEEPPLRDPSSASLDPKGEGAGGSQLGPTAHWAWLLAWRVSTVHREQRGRSLDGLRGT
ncbi:hypothetical protein H1C71_041872, partial [Ictidomys tridecemlineatus]